MLRLLSVVPLLRRVALRRISWLRILACGWHGASRSGFQLVGRPVEARGVGWRTLRVPLLWLRPLLRVLPRLRVLPVHRGTTRRASTPRVTTRFLGGFEKIDVTTRVC